MYDEHRSGAIGGGVITDLTRRITAPTVCFVCRRDGTGVFKPCGNPHEYVTRYIGNLDKYGDIAVCCSTIAELSFVVCAPAICAMDGRDTCMSIIE